MDGGIEGGREGRVSLIEPGGQAGRDPLIEASHCAPQCPLGTWNQEKKLDVA